MANPEHLAIIKKGVEVWNRWRRENPELRIDLSKADLYGADLCGADLRGVDLYRADLRGVNFYGADLGGADLGGADLDGVDLHGADLRRANLDGANLDGADLDGADLRRASLYGANLVGAKFKNARCWTTVFTNVDLSETKNLDSIGHEGPSTIGIDTLYKSKGSIPEAFLRGFGVPDQMIEYVNSLTGSPIEYYSCFISYSNKDEEFAKRLWEELQAKNVRCWLACEDMKIGDKIRPTIEESIRLHDKLLLIFSEHSMKSKWVKHEVENALDLEIERDKTVLFPVRVDDAVMESKADWASTIKEKRHIGDFTKWKDHDAYSKAFDRLLRDLKAG